MQKKKSFFPVFLIFFILTILIFLLSRSGFINGFTGFFEDRTIPLSHFVFGITKGKSDPTEVAKVKDENAKLISMLVKQKELETENQSLRDQFRTTTPSPRNLVPANIIGQKDQELTLDKGQKDLVKVGSIVIYKDNLIGTIIKSSQNASIVALATRDTSIIAKTLKTQAAGILKSTNGKIILDNITLSEKLDKGDFVITKGDKNLDGVGFPPGLVIGKINSINKNSSSLFQTAEVESLVDVSKLSTVFIIL